MAVNPELNGLTLRDYLIKPVQRLCKYPLLMRVQHATPAVCRSSSIDSESHVLCRCL
jgi:hypothetical protein